MYVLFSVESHEGSDVTSSRLYLLPDQVVPARAGTCPKRMEERSNYSCVLHRACCDTYSIVMLVCESGKMSTRPITSVASAAFSKNFLFDVPEFLSIAYRIKQPTLGSFPVRPAAFFQPAISPGLDKT